jgi:serine/threonine protein kinase
MTDLGLAWFLMEELESGTQAVVGKASSLVGTADYLAPETIRDPRKILPVSDVYSLGCTLYYAVTGKVPFPGGNTADKIRRHLDETPLNPLHFNPDLPPGFCDVIASMMDKNPDKRTPTAAAVVELLRTWRDENATKHLAEETPPGSGIFFRGGAPAPPASSGLDETASYVLDDLDFPPGQIESPSQISQGTVSVASETEDTLAGVPAVRRSAPVMRTVPLPVEPPRKVWPKLLILAGAVGALVGLAIAAAWWLGLFR